MRLLPVTFVSFENQYAEKNGEVGVLSFSPGVGNTKDEVETVLNIGFNDENMKQLLESINEQVEIVGGKVIWKNSDF